MLSPAPSPPTPHDDAEEWAKWSVAMQNYQRDIEAQYALFLKVSTGFLGLLAALAATTLVWP